MAVRIGHRATVEDGSPVLKPGDGALCMVATRSVHPGGSVAACVPVRTRPGASPALAARLRLLDALAQRVHEVDDLGALALLPGLAERLGGRDRLALLDLGVDELAELDLVLVLELLGGEVGLEAGDQWRLALVGSGSLDTW